MGGGEGVEGLPSEVRYVVVGCVPVLPVGVLEGALVMWFAGCLGTAMQAVVSIRRC